MRHKEYFNDIAHKWDEISKHDSNKLVKITEMAGLSKGDKVLDVGTGTGVMLPFIKTLIGDEGKIVAVDIAEKMLDIARKKHPYDNVSFVLGDVCEIQVPNDYFDVVMCYSVFPHFQDKKTAISHIAKLLKSSGRLAIAHSQSRDAINNLHRNSSDTVKCDNLPKASIIEEYMKEAGLNPICTKDDDEMFVVIGEKA